MPSKPVVLDDCSTVASKAATSATCAPSRDGTADSTCDSLATETTEGTHSMNAVAHLGQVKADPLPARDEIGGEGQESTSARATNMVQLAPPKPMGGQSIVYTCSSSSKQATLGRRPMSYPSMRREGQATAGEFPFLSLKVPDQSNQLRALLLPDLVRARGVRLVSATELASLHRRRSHSEPTKTNKTHRRTLSMPIHMYLGRNPWGATMQVQGDGSVDSDIHQGTGRIGYMRDIDLDTSDEPGTWWPSVEDGWYEATEDDYLDEELQNTIPPPAGVGHSFRYPFEGDDGSAEHSALGSFHKPVVMVFQHDPFFSFSRADGCDDELEERRHGHCVQGDAREWEFAIEVWVVEEDRHVSPVWGGIVAYECEDEDGDGDDNDWITLGNELEEDLQERAHECMDMLFCVQ